jgi:UDP-N-acetyl-D-mannosaminuronate dehydrogenase
MDPTYIAINSPTKDKAEKKQLLQKALGNLTRNIDKIELQSKQYYKNMMTKLVLQNLRDAELVKLSEAFKEIDYADINQLQNLFEYRNKD